MAFVEEPEELIEPAPLRMIFRRAAKMPFPESARGVTGGFHCRSQSCFGEREANLRIEIGCTYDIAFMTEPGLIASRHKSGPRRSTERRAHIALREAHPARRDGINIRSRNLGIALATEFAIPEIVGKDDDDVGRPARRRRKLPPGQERRREKRPSGDGHEELLQLEEPGLERIAQHAFNDARIARSSYASIVACPDAGLDIEKFA